MKGSDLFKYILGGLIVTGFFILLVLLVFREMPAKNNDLLNLIVGSLIGCFTSVVGYYFGSSAGSAKKDETISEMANK